MWAVRLGLTEIVKAILASDKCSTEVLQHAYIDGRTALMLAVQDGKTEIIEAIHTCISYQTLWESEEKEEDKILSLLNNYCKGTVPVLSQLSVFAHGHFNRHNTGAVRDLLKEYERGNKTLDNMLDKLKQLPKNKNGSLARRLKFIELKRHPKEPEDTQQDSPRLTGPA